MPIVLLAFCAALLLSSCSGRGSQSAAATRAARTQPDVITEAELSDPALGDADALTVLKRVRPAFLSSRGRVSVNNPEGGTTHVSVDGGPLTTLDVLATMRASQLVELRFFGASAAAQRYGAASMAGPVIAVRRR